MKKLDLSFGDGFPLDQETLLFMQTSYFDGIGNLSKAIGDNVILSGCEVTGNTLASGWAVYQNEVLFVQGATKATGQVFTYSILSNNTLATYQGGSVYPSYGDRYIKVIGSPSTPNFVDDFKRITSLKDTNTKVSTLETNYTALQTSLATLQSTFNYYVTTNNNRVQQLELQPYKILYCGSKAFVDVYNEGYTGSQLIETISFPALETSYYAVIGSIKSINASLPLANNISYTTFDLTLTSFKLSISESFDKSQGSFVFDYFLIERQ